MNRKFSHVSHKDLELLFCKNVESIWNAFPQSFYVNNVRERFAVLF